MPLEINITKLQSDEIIKILNLYPYGHLENKFESQIFWISDRIEQVQTRDMPSVPPVQGGRLFTQQKVPPAQQAARSMKRMSDVLGSMMGP